MKSIYDSRQRLKFIFIFVAIIIAIASVVVSDMLIGNLAQEEREKMEIWAEATKLIGSENQSSDMSLILKILQGNTTIPVLLCDEKDNIIDEKNIDAPENRDSIYDKKLVAKFKQKNKIEIALGDGTNQYVYYDDSIILKRLLIYPYAQLSVVFVFIILAFLALASTKKAEQNKVWVGLSKETAHQLGTPISSLIAWMEYLKLKELDSEILNEMNKDIRRLEIIADRFSKIGSNPAPVPTIIASSIKNSVDYMRTRISSRITVNMSGIDSESLVLINESLFSWVIENLTKNAVDAMEGQGILSFKLIDKGKKVVLEVSDTGKGIPKSRFKTIFNPGYTTKSRGWGLGLSLVKRIIESYTGGKIYVKNSEIGKGTTFRIELKKYNP